MTVHETVTSTPTGKARTRIPAHRRKAQTTQTVWGLLAGSGGCLLVYVIGASQVWYLVAVLVGMRIASREFLMDCLKIARDIVTFQRAKAE